MTTNTKAEWIDFITRCGYKYFMTVTLNHKSTRSDEDLERFIRIIHQRLFGRNFIKNKKLLGLTVIKEQQKLNNFKDHYHILVEDHEAITHFILATTMLAASKKCRSINNIEGHQFKHLMTNYYKENSPKANGVHLNVVEIETEDDLNKIVSYLCKTGAHDNFSNIYTARAGISKDYFPIITGN